MKNLSEPIYFESELYEIYASKRENISVEEVQDMMDCIIKWTKGETRSNKYYAIKFSNLGFMYRRYHKEKPEMMLNLRAGVARDIWMELCYNTKSERYPHTIDRVPIRGLKLYSGLTLEEMQKKQNDDLDNT